MDAIGQLRQLWQHAAWADEMVLTALRRALVAPAADTTAAGSSPVALAWHEYAHVLGAAEVWLARLEQRAPRTPVWPTLSPADAEALAGELRAGYAAYLATLDASALERPVPYVNSAGQSFATPAGDILLQVVLHGQYHRGKVNLLLRQAGEAPAPVDYIAFVRGVPAATTRR